MMECNKEEALRAKVIAEKKMENGDYAGARKIATKAQNLHPDLENISQMICVCEVHCSAETTVFENEKDWYSILQVNPTADDAVIKRQYRKFAFLLHPDKNKFFGAEAAFKLIGEAQRTLLDSQKRAFFDVKWKALNRHMVSNRPPSKSSMKKMPNKQPGVENKFTDNFKSFPKEFNFSTNQQAQSAVPNGKETFWTMCPLCSLRCQYYKVLLNKSICCPTCKKPFVAYDMHLQAMPRRSNVNQTTSSSQAELNSPSMAHSARSGFVGNLHQQDANVGSSSVSGSTKATEPSKPTEVSGSRMTSEQFKCGERTRKPGVDEGSSPLRKANKKPERKELSESSESFGSESTTDSDEEELEAELVSGMNVGDENSHRRSGRTRSRVTYNEVASDDEELQNPSKKAKMEGNGDSSSEEELSEKSKSGSDENINLSAKRKVNGITSMAGENQTKSSTDDHVSPLNTDFKVSQEPDVQVCLDPEFSDFDGVRSEECFKVGQIWAVYDDLNMMPRYYAEIRKVFSPGFKLKITWLEADPDEDHEDLWARKELPMACGKYKYGDSHSTDAHLMFSHPIFFERCGGSLKIYPKKGETWALFKDWHIGWINQSKEEISYNSDYVEVLSEYDPALGIRVGLLGKLRGFSSLFCRKSGEELQIPPNELLRFSHRVPSFKMTGRERDDVPQGAFELDTACVSLNLEEISIPPEMKVGPPEAISEGSPESVEAHLDSKFKGEASSRQNEETRINDEHPSIPVNDDDLENYFSVDEDCDTPEPEFYDFEGAKVLDKLRINQIWALYSDADGMPKYYVLIKKINPHSDPKLEIVWLDSLPPSDDLIEWKDEEIPVTCGRFRIMSKGRQPYDDLAAFSHEVIPHQILRGATTVKTTFEIYPRKGEIWALYKNWRVEMSAAELLCCEYDIVEVQENLGCSSFRVSVLVRVPDFKTVVKPQIDDSSPVIVEIPYKELLRFSHLIPSYKLTDERGGSLRGCWELDPNALPSSFFS